MPDGYEAVNGLNPLADDAFDDNDNDGYSNIREYLSGSSPEDMFSLPDMIGDFDDDGDTDAQDLLEMIRKLWTARSLSSGFSPSDFNKDGVVDFFDLRIFSEDYGRNE